MKVNREQCALNRERVLDAAGRLFREKGFDRVSVAEVMGAAGLTHGGFYGHFASKDALAAEAARQAFAKSAARWRSIVERSPEPAFESLIAHYLSTRHRDDPQSGCACATLGGDAPRQGQHVRAAFAEGIENLISALADSLPDEAAGARRRKALFALSSMVGAMVLARSVDDEKLSAECLGAVASELLDPSGGPRRASGKTKRRSGPRSSR